MQVIATHSNTHFSLSLFQGNYSIFIFYYNVLVIVLVILINDYKIIINNMWETYQIALIFDKHFKTKNIEKFTQYTSNKQHGYTIDYNMFMSYHHTYCTRIILNCNYYIYIYR